MYMFVMTVDQRNSSDSPDLIPHLEKGLPIDLHREPPLRTFQRTAGDEAQAVFENPQSLLATALTLSREGNWHIGIGAGAINQPLPAAAREGNGQAYRRARTAVERAKKSPGHIAFEGGTPYAPLIEASLQLVMGLEEDRKDTWQEVGYLYDTGMTQKEIAQELGTYQSAISRSLKQGRWQETRRFIKELAVLLREES